MEFIAICDDNEQDRQCLAERIRKNQEYQSDEMEIQQYASGMDLIEAMEVIRFSAVILDIVMDGMDGEETARRVRAKDFTLILAFYTGCAHPTPKSFYVQPYRYMRKDMTGKEINEQISDILVKIKADSKVPFLDVTAGKSKLKIRLDSVVFIEKCKRGLRVHVTQSTKCLLERQHYKEGLPDLKINEKLNEVYERIKEYGFGRPHDSYVVNYRYVTYSTKDMLQMAGRNDYLRISDSMHKEFLRRKDIFLCSKYGEEGIV